MPTAWFYMVRGTAVRTFAAAHIVRRHNRVRSLFLGPGGTAVSQIRKSEIVTASGSLASPPASAIHERTLHRDTTSQSTTS